MVRSDVPIHPSRMLPDHLAVAWRLTDPPAIECAYDPDLHTADSEGVESEQERAARVEVARQVCLTCPLLMRCARYAAEVSPVSGVWAGRDTAEAGTDPVREGLIRHTITVERLDPVTAAEVGRPEAACKLAVVERYDGRLGKICAVESDLWGSVTIDQCARGIARTYGARYVPATLAPAESAVA
ncbi:WhiB family transcriptional regulator [Nonomuraea sp. SBT364]|uniref:WhiB family transcriptional regulator n=1 Tax=Nonomuraea sp. SBT364 TaxID=1580530 RepID=UPI00066D07FA|nr:WhiB family transcriptional regulator [Nonomuraea sp. SBT364]